MKKGLTLALVLCALGARAMAMDVATAKIEITRARGKAADNLGQIERVPEGFADIIKMIPFAHERKAAAGETPEAYQAFKAKYWGDVAEALGAESERLEKEAAEARGNGEFEEALKLVAQSAKLNGMFQAAQAIRFSIQGDQQFLSDKRTGTADAKKYLEEKRRFFGFIAQRSTPV